MRLVTGSFGQCGRPAWLCLPAWEYFESQNHLVGKDLKIIRSSHNLVPPCTHLGTPEHILQEDAAVFMASLLVTNCPWVLHQIISDE